MKWPFRKNKALQPQTPECTQYDIGGMQITASRRTTSNDLEVEIAGNERDRETFSTLLTTAISHHFDYNFRTNLGSNTETLIMTPVSGRAKPALSEEGLREILGKLQEALPDKETFAEHVERFRREVEGKSVIDVLNLMTKRSTRERGDNSTPPQIGG